MHPWKKKDGFPLLFLFIGYLLFVDDFILLMILFIGYLLFVDDFIYWLFIVC